MIEAATVRPHLCKKQTAKAGALPAFLLSCSISISAVLRIITSFNLILWFNPIITEQWRMFCQMLVTKWFANWFYTKPPIEFLRNLVKLKKTTSTLSNEILSIAIFVTIHFIYSFGFNWYGLSWIWCFYISLWSALHTELNFRVPYPKGSNGTLLLSIYRPSVHLSVGILSVRYILAASWNFHRICVCIRFTLCYII